MAFIKNFARFNTSSDGYYLDYEVNSYGVDSGNIGCVEVEGVEVEDIDEDNDLGKFHIFDFPFKCSKNEVEGYLRFGDVFIKTDQYVEFFLPPHLNTYKGKASLEFGEKFLNNNIHISEIANGSSEYWLDKANSISYGDIVDKTVEEIYRVKSKILLNQNDPNKAFICLVNNHGLCQISEAFLRIFNDIFDLDDDEDDEDDQSISLFDFVDNSKLDIVQLKDIKITNISSLNLEEDPEIKADIKNRRIENLLEKVRSNLRKQLWSEGRIAADWWQIHSVTKEKEGDKDYALMASLMAKFHLKELSGDKVYTEGSKLSKEDQYRIYFDMVQNCEWFFKLEPD